MANQLTGESYEEYERKGKEKSKKRFIILGSLVVVAVLARMILKDPPKYVEPDHQDAQMRYLPGMLERMTEERRNELTPEQLAAFKKADEDFRLAKLGITKEEENQTYEPTAPYSEIQEDIDAYQEEIFQYARRKQRMEEVRIEHELEERRHLSQLVLFRKGGYIRAERISTDKNRVRIMVDRTSFVNVPKRIVKNIKDNAYEWEEPVPRGYVKLNPARGIKITVRKGTAKNISIKKKDYEMDI